MNARQSSALFGRNRHRSRQFSVLAAALFLASTLIYTTIVLGGLPDTFLFMIGPVVVAFVMATINAYLNYGLLVSGLITGAFGFGGTLAMYIDASLGPVSYPVTLTVGVRVIAFFVGIGIVAFAIGTITRRVIIESRE